MENTLQKKPIKSLAQMSIREKINRAKDKFFAANQSLSEKEVLEMWERESGYALQIFHNNEYLGKMDPVSIVTAIANVALTGLTLNPELRLAYLVPRKGKLYFNSSYQGKREILMRAGVVKDVWANLVFENDEFSVEDGTYRQLIHRPRFFGERGNLMGGYWMAVLKNGEKPFGVMPLSRINEIKARSESVKSGSFTPWDSDFEEMAKKTILNWGFKSLPKTGIPGNILKAMEVESELEKEELNDWKARQQSDHDSFMDEIEDAHIVDEPKRNPVPQGRIPKQERGNQVEEKATPEA